MINLCIVLLLLLMCDLSLCEDNCEGSKTIIKVSQKFELIGGCVEYGVNIFHCVNLQSAFNLTLTHSCVTLLDDQIVSSKIILSNVENLVITKHYDIPNPVYVNCSSITPAGFVFMKSTNIFISGLHFNHCGVKHPTFSTSASLYFYQVHNLIIKDISLKASNGYAIVFINVNGILALSKVDISNASPWYQRWENETSINSFSGGIYLESNSSSVEHLLSNSSVLFDTCKFCFNSARNYSKVNSSELEDGPATGGGLTLNLAGNTKSNTFHITNCIFSNNIADLGGGVYISFEGKASENRIVFNHTVFNNNKAYETGGGLMIKSFHNSAFYRNEVELRNCLFDGNVALFEGGGLTILFVKRPYKLKADVILYNCSFRNNIASFGSALHMQHVSINFVNLTISGQYSSRMLSHFSLYDISNNGGGLYAYKSVVNFYGFNRVYGSQNTAFILQSSLLCLKGHLYFGTNKGYNGGALSLIGRSSVYMHQNAILDFHDNTAIKSGGALYVSVSNVIVLSKMSIDFQMYQCFFIFEGGLSHFNGKVIFRNNRCYKNNSGDDIFASTLQNCKHVDSSSSSDLRHWRNFKFSHNHSISTFGVQIAIFPHEWDGWPGKLMHPHIILYDEQYNRVDGAVSVFIHSEKNVIRSESGSQFLTKDNRITLKVLSGRRTKNSVIRNFNLTVALSRDSSIRKSLSNLQLTACPFGFSFTDHKCICNIQKNKVRGIAPCYNDKAYIFLGRWASPTSQELNTDSEKTFMCPPNYCRQACLENVTGFECLYKPGINQCNLRRNQSSRLCSQCERGLSVSFGGEECIDCSSKKDKWNVLWVVPLIIAVLLVVVIFILFLNVDIYNYYLNGFFYYYQVVPILLPSDFTYNGIQTFITIINLEGPGKNFPHFCLWDGLNDLHKSLFNYIFPVSMILILYVISLYARYKQENRMFEIFLKQNCIRTFVVITVWAYSDMTRITFSLLRYVKFGTKDYVWIYAEAEKSSWEYIPFAIVTYIFLIIGVIGFPVTLMLSSWLVGLHYREYASPFAKWQLVFDTFKYSFKANMEYFASYYFICRMILLGIRSSRNTPEFKIVVSLICFCICIIFQLCLPYKDIWMNIFDIMALGNLSAVSVLSITSSVVKTDLQKKACMTCINVLMTIPMTVVFFRMGYLLSCKIWIMVKKKNGHQSHNDENISSLEEPLLIDYVVR